MALNHEQSERSQRSKFRIELVIALIGVLTYAISAVVYALYGFVSQTSSLYWSALIQVPNALVWLYVLVRVLKRQDARSAFEIAFVFLFVTAPLNSLFIAGIGAIVGLGTGIAAVAAVGLVLPNRRVQWFMIGAVISAIVSFLLDLFGSAARVNPALPNSTNNILIAVATIIVLLLLISQFRNFSLRTKLITVFVALAVISTLGITLVSAQAIRDSLSSTLARDLRTRAQAAALAVGITMDRNVDRLLTLTLDRNVQDAIQSVDDAYPSQAPARTQLIAENTKRWESANPQDRVIQDALNSPLSSSLHKFSSVFPGNKEMFMTDAFGAVVAATDWQPTYDFSNAEWWRISYNAGRGTVYIGQPEFNPMINEYGIRIAMPIYQVGTPKVVGVLHSIFTLNALQQTLFLNNFGQTGKIDLLFPTGQILTSDGTFRALTADEFTQIKAGIGDPLAVLDYRGTPLLSGQGVVGVTDVQPEPYLRSSAWRAIATVQEEEVLGAIEAGAQAALLAGIVSIGIAILVALLLAQFLTRPIRRLTTVAEEIQSGNLAARAPVETGDEIGALARTFNGMTARLQDTLMGLELRVTERTRELSQANLNLQANSAYLSALSDTSAGLFERLDVSELLHAILERAGALVGTQHGFVFFSEPGDSEIEMRVGAGLYDDLVGTRAQPGIGLAGTVWQSGQPMTIEDYQKWEGRLPGSRRDALRAIVAVPLKRGGGVGSQDDETVGVIGLAYTDGERKFGKTEVEILQRFAQLASIALDNATLYANSEQRVQELGVLNSISQIIVQPGDFKTTIERVGEKIRNSFDADFGYFALVNQESNLIEFPYAVDDGARIELEPIKLGEGITSQVIQTGEPVLLTHATAGDYERLGAVDSGDGSSPHSLLAVPVRTGEQVIGALSVQRVAQDRPFTDEDLRLLTTIATNVGVGVENVRLAEATLRRVQELSALNRISAILNTPAEFRSRLHQVGFELAKIFQVSSVYIAMYDVVHDMVEMPFFVEDGIEQEIPPRPRGTGLVSHMLQTREPLVINHNMQQRFEELGGIWIGNSDVQTKSYLGVPLVVGNTALGAIALNAETENRFTDADLKFLQTLAATVAAAIENARLLEQTQERARELAAVNSLAREITQQRSLASLFDQVYLQVKSVSSADGLVLSLYDEGTDTLTVPFLIDEGERHQITPEALQWERTYAAQVRTGEPILINSTPEQVAELEAHPAVAGSGRASRSRLYIPLMAGANFLGMLSVHSYTYNAYTQRDVAVLTGLASHIAVALENARLFEQTQNALAETNRLYRITEAANAETDELAFYKRVHEIVGEAMDAKNFFVALYNEADSTLDMAYYVDEKDVLPEMPLRRVNMGSGVTAYVLRTRKPLRATRAEIKALAERGELQQHGGESEAWLGVPMLVGDKPIGVIAVQSYAPGAVYSERHEQILVRLSQALANAIERKRAEEALRQSQAQLAETMRLTRLGNWEYDVASDTFTFNDDFYAMMRTTAEREGGYTMHSAQYAERFVYPEDAPMVGQEVVAALETTDPNYLKQLDHRVYFGDGQLGYVSVRIRVRKDAAGRTVQTYGANLDITDRKRAEIELQAALDETQRLAEQARESASQVTALNRRLTREGWREYLEQLNSRLVVEAGGEEYGNGNGALTPERSGGHNGDNGNDANGNGKEKILVPIQLRGEVIGEIELEPDQTARPMTPEDMGLVTHIAENIGLALDNARLFTETQRRLTELDALNSISLAVTSELELDSLLNVIGEQLRSIFEVQNIYIALYDSQTQMISLPYFVNDNERVTVEPIPYGEGITSHIIRTREPLIINSNVTARMVELGARVFGNPARSYLGVPIFVGDDVTGVISIQSTEREGLFDEANVRLMETIAATVGTAIQNAQLYGAMQQEVVVRQRAEEEIKLSLKEKEVLLKEIHHRVKNNLQIITSLLNLQSAQIKDPDAIMLFRESQSRVRSMALIHEKLYQSKDLARIDFDGYLRDLMVYLFRSYAANPDQIRTHIESGNMYLGIDTAIPCGLMISELVTNTIKYAFPNGRRGNLYVSIGPEDDGHLTLLVRDDGVGFPEGFDWRESDSLGLQLVSTLTSQLHGTVQVDGKNGTSFKITFPG